MSNRVNHVLKFRDANLIFCNFSGRPTRFNQRGGKPSFGLILTPEEAQQFSDEGWTVKRWRPRNADPEDDDIFFFEVKFNYGDRLPKIWQITSRNRTLLTNTTVGMLDSMLGDIERVDVIIRPYNWVNDDGEIEVKPYLKTMYVTIAEDEFFDEYADLPVSSSFDEDAD